MKKKINDILLNMQAGKICIGEAANELLVLHNVTNRFLAIAHYPSMNHKIHDVIELPSEEWKHADGTYCDAQYFLDYPDYFKEI